MASLNSSQVLTLQTLAKHEDGLDQETLEKKSGASISPANLGPVHKETLKEGNGTYAKSLYGLGLVKPEQQPNGVVLWKATAKGLKEALEVKTKKRVNKLDIIPAKVLDPVIQKFRVTRTYGFESYTDDDIREIKKQIGKEYADISLDSVRQQITNRRKQGAYADPKKKELTTKRKAVIAAVDAYWEGKGTLRAVEDAVKAAKFGPQFPC